MVIGAVNHLFERDLNKLKEEIWLYPNEHELWAIKSGISNSGGNLCLHLIGNLNHFIGAVIGKTGYIRHREEEFTLKKIPRSLMAADIDQTVIMIKTVLTGIQATDLEKEFPVEFGGKKNSTGYVLMHLVAHLNYHLGQINYHRRLMVS